MFFPRRMSIVRFSPQSIAEHIRLAFFNTEMGWANVFGEAWEPIVQALEGLPPRASEGQIFTALPARMAMHLPFLLCASCKTPATQLINLGSVNAAFLVCESCLEESLTTLHPQDPTQ